MVNLNVRSLNFRSTFLDGGFTMKSKALLCVCVVLAFITSNLTAATFQWLGNISPESFVGEKYIYFDNDMQVPIAVGQGRYFNGQLTDVILGQTEDTLFSRPCTVPCKGIGELGDVYDEFFEPLLPSEWLWSWGCQGAGTAISADGSTVVGFVGDGLDVINAFRWTESEGMSYLMPEEEMGSCLYNLANDVSANGGIIVGWYNVFTDYDVYKNAFIWDTTNGWQDLTAVAIGQYNINLRSCRLTDAIGISEDGTQIYGYGLNASGIQEGFILTIPEPATLALLTLGGMVLRRKR
jgi:hypothetical protein